MHVYVTIIPIVALVGMCIVTPIVILAILEEQRESKRGEGS